MKLFQKIQLKIMDIINQNTKNIRVKTRQKKAYKSLTICTRFEYQRYRDERGKRAFFRQYFIGVRGKEAERTAAPQTHLNPEKLGNFYKILPEVEQFLLKSLACFSNF